MPRYTPRWTLPISRSYTSTYRKSASGITVPVLSNTQSSASSIVGGTAPLAHTFCSRSRAEKVWPSYQNERLTASPDASPTSRSGRRIATRRTLVSCCRGASAGTSSYTSSASTASAVTRASRSLICRINSWTRGSTRREPGASSVSIGGGGGSAGAFEGVPLLPQPRTGRASAVTRISEGHVDIRSSLEFEREAHDRALREHVVREERHGLTRRVVDVQPAIAELERGSLGEIHPDGREHLQGECRADTETADLRVDLRVPAPPGVWSPDLQADEGVEPRLGSVGAALIGPVESQLGLQRVYAAAKKEVRRRTEP